MASGQPYEWIVHQGQRKVLANGDPFHTHGRHLLNGKRFVIGQLGIALASCCALLSGLNSPAMTDEIVAADPPLRWWKGNIHTHTLWSDGNDFPEMVAEWYRVHEYNFLALSDHNVLSEGIRWMPYAKISSRGGRNTPAKLARYSSPRRGSTRPTVCRVVSCTCERS